MPNIKNSKTRKTKTRGKAVTALGKITFFLVIAITFALLSMFPTWGSTTGQEEDKRVEVEITENLKKDLQTLPEDEKDEQMRDWVVLSYVNNLEGDAKTKFAALYDFTPIRNDFMVPVSNYKHGESRSITLKSGELIVFVPYDSPKKDVYIARHSDEYRMVYGTKPQKAIIVEYQADSGNSPGASFIQTQILNQEDLFSEKMGYYESIVSTKEQLESFLKMIDDIVYVGMGNQQDLTLGGRKFSDFPMMGVNLEDLVVIYQAYGDLLEQNIKEYLPQVMKNPKSKALYESNIDKKANEILSEIKGLDNKLSLEETKNLIKIIMPLEKFCQEIAEKLGKMKVHLGFSLDPQINYKKFGDELTLLTSGDKNSIRQWFDNYKKPYLIEEFELSRKTQTENGLKLLYTPGKNESIGEISLITLLYGTQPFAKEKKESLERSLNDSLVEKYNLTKEDLNENLETDFEGIYSSIEKNRDILMEMAKEISEKKIGLYLDVRRYLEGKNPINLSMKRKIHSSLDKIIFRDVLDMLYANGYLETKEKEAFDEDVNLAVRSFQEDNNLPVNGIVDLNTYLVLLSDFGSDQKWDELMYLNDFLNRLKYLCSYQKARYDGKINGTEVGMTLFYTDLTMKVWGDDREKSAPERAITGFKAEVNYPLDYCFKEEEEKNPASRYWLGPLESGYEFNSSKDKLFFAPIATRVFCKSSDDLFFDKEKEEEAVPSSARFVGWWNNHYSEVADYEPQYHRLNQIMKWVAVFTWLKDQNRFEYLNTIHYKRDLDFQQWYNTKKERNELSSAVNIPFLDKTKLGETTECIELLRSRQFVMFADYDKNTFDNRFFIGGVTLNPKLMDKMRISKNPEIIENRWVRAETIHTPHTTGTNFAWENGASIKLNPDTYTTTIKNTTGKFRTSSSEFRDLPISRSINSDLLALKIQDKAWGLKVNEFSATRSGNKVSLSSSKSDFSKSRELLSQVNRDPGKMEQILSSTNDIKIPIKTGEGKYVAQLKESGNWIEISSTNEKLSKGYHITMSDGQTNQNLAFINNKTRDKIFASDTWLRTDTTNGGHIPELTHTFPSPDEIRCTLYLGEEGLPKIKVILTEDSFYLKNSLSTGKNNLEILETLGIRQGNDINLLRKEFIDGKNVNALIYKNDGKVLQISRGSNLSAENRQLFNELIPHGKGNLKGILFEEGENIRFIGDDIISIPSNCTLEQKEVLRFISEKISRNKDWAKCFQKADNIIIDDIRILKNLDENNLKLAESFYPFKAAKNLPHEYALVDISSSGSKPQLLLKTEDLGIIIVNTESNFSKNIDEIGELLRQFYSGKKSMSYDEFINEIRPVGELLEKARSETKAATIIIKGPADINPQLVARIFKLNGRFIKDQPDMNKSVKNAQMDIIPKIDESIFLSSVPLEDSNFDEIGQVYNDMIDSGIDLLPNLDIELFLEYMDDEEITQLILMVRATEKGIVFSNRLISYEEMDQWLQKVEKDKELLYIISNEANRLQEFFSKTGKFNYVISSGYTEGDELSFLLTLKFLQEFYPEAIGNRNITHLYHYKTQDRTFDSRPVLIPVVFPSPTAEIPGNPVNIRNIIDRVSNNFINNLKNKPAPELFLRWQKAIPVLKVQNSRVEDKERYYFGEFNTDYREFA
jgi:peptidoglycan hydrolase-like protein with peptidoglycan-binding domain